MTNILLQIGTPLLFFYGQVPLSCSLLNIPKSKAPILLFPSQSVKQISSLQGYTFVGELTYQVRFQDMKRIKKISIRILIALALIYLTLIIVAYLPYETTPIEELAKTIRAFLGWKNFTTPPILIQ